MELSAFVTKVKALVCLIRGLTLAIAIVPAALAGTALAVDLNQHGLTGSWYQPATSGEGIELEIYPDLVAPGVGFLQGSWLTFTTLGSWDYGHDISASGQRWYTFGGTVPEAAERATFTLYENRGGNFNRLPVTSAVPVGTVVLSFSDCTTARMEYAFNDGVGDRASGTISLIRLLPNVTCTVSGAGTHDADFGYSGNWFDPVTAGQGFFFEVNPEAGVMFLVWHTYAPEGQSETGGGQRWYTGLGNFTPGLRSIPMTLHQTTGGLRDGGGGVTEVVGTATAILLSCNAAMLTFTFIGGTSAGMSDTINLSRVGPTPADCGP